MKDIVSVDVLGFFDNITNFILKEIRIVFKQDPNLNNSFVMEPPYDFTLLNTKSRKTAIWLSNKHHNIVNIVSSLILRKLIVRPYIGLRETGFHIVKHILRAGFVL